MRRAEEQDWRCEICGIEKRGVGTEALYVDHDHETGEVRGLLCMPCNTAIGHFDDNRELLVKATDYLDKYGVLAYAIHRTQLDV